MAQSNALWPQPAEGEPPDEKRINPSGHDRFPMFESVPSFCVAKLERQLGERVRVIGSDGGHELGGGEAIEWYRSTRIQSYTSLRCMPEMNGGAERMVMHA
jgi:hypothetical protein